MTLIEAAKLAREALKWLIDSQDLDVVCRQDASQKGLEAIIALDQAFAEMDSYRSAYPDNFIHPLTDDEILAVARDHYNPHQRPEISFARAIEAAHGIKE